jgi:hypothetical protein
LRKSFNANNLIFQTVEDGLKLMVHHSCPTEFAPKLQTRTEARKAEAERERQTNENRVAKIKALQARDPELTNFCSRLGPDSGARGITTPCDRTTG